jgi:pimeloyl-ACP methyl ester carboxylesterase
MDMNTFHIPGLILTDHEFTVPLNYSKSDGEQITIFAREVSAPDKKADTLPWLLFLEGGPGIQSPRPEHQSGWLKRALQDYRVLLLDQRGTGRSTVVNHQTLARFQTAEAQAEYLMNFRADSIIKDAEIIHFSEGY